jgi:hypothetical protein
MDILNTKMNWYINPMSTMAYKYLREYQTTLGPTTLTLLVNNQQYNISFVGVPDGVSPSASEVLIVRPVPKRLCIFANQPIPEPVLAHIDTLYGQIAYPILNATIVTGQQMTYPVNNFYLCNGPPSSISEFVEYRYLQQRHIISNIAYDNDSGRVYRLVQPKRQMLVLIMPSNFIRTSNKSGYFRFDDNLIVRCFSQYLLASDYTDDTDTGEVTNFDINFNDKMIAAIEIFFSRLGIHKITSNSNNQIYGYDKYITLIVGSIANIVL